MNSWEIIPASVTGPGHLEKNQPCQDSYSYQAINNNCGVAIISDGAGSCKNSHLGSSFVTKKGLDLFIALIQKHNWEEQHPDEEKWRLLSIETVQNLVESLKKYASESELTLQSLSSTFIVVFYSRYGILSLNIGDGRGAVKLSDGTWRSIVSPYHGEQVGMTVFVTSECIWDDSECFISTYSIEEKVDAFIILTDGYEKMTFTCFDRNSEGVFYSLNKPFAPFLDYKVETTRKLLKSESNKNIRKKWEAFLKTGNPILMEETDDKTMVLGILF